MSSAQDRLPSGAEALLKEWPLAEPNWEALATKAVDKARTSSGVDLGDVLGAPLPAESGEPGFEAQPAAAAEGASEVEAPAPAPVAAAAPKSLADLARASMKKKADSTRDIALESMAVATRSRAEVEQIAERVQAVSRAPAPSVPEAEAPPPKSVSAEAPVSEGAAPAPRSIASAAKVAPSRTPWLVGGVALAAAAALVLGLSRREPPAAVSMAPVGPAVQAEATVAQVPEQAKSLPEGQQQAQAAPQEAVAALPPSEAPRGAAGPAAAAKAGAGAPAAAPAPSAAASGVKPEAVQLEDEEAPQPVASAPAPVASEPMKPAELPKGGLPDRPSSGAVTAAIGSVMGQARACVAGQDDPSTANITFGSDGKVKSVAVSGPAAGTPAAACIQNAFKRASVQPFAKPSFSIGTTIRRSSRQYQARASTPLGLTRPRS